MKRKLREVMSGAIGQLSGMLPAILVLKEADGFSHEEIADVPDCFRGTVKPGLFRTQEQLQDNVRPSVRQP